MTTLRRATVDDAPAITAFQKAQGYDYPIWQEANLKANIAAGDHVHIMLAEDDHQLVGFIHWVEAQTDDGPAAAYVGVIVDRSLSAAAKLACRTALSLSFGDSMHFRGKWFHWASKDNTSGIAYARLMSATTELDTGPALYFEGDIATSYADYKARTP
jgi:hypothetical protein